MHFTMRKMSSESHIDGLGSVPLLHDDESRQVRRQPVDFAKQTQADRIARALSGEELSLSERDLAAIREVAEFPK